MSSAFPIVYKNFALTLGRSGCRNRYFYNIIITPRKSRKFEGDIIEQIGTFDPLPNDTKEKLVGINFSRLKYWLARDDVVISSPVLQLLGLSGFFPLHPLTFDQARKTRQQLEKLDKQLLEAKEFLTKQDRNRESA